MPEREYISDWILTDEKAGKSNAGLLGFGQVGANQRQLACKLAKLSISSVAYVIFLHSLLCNVREAL